MKLKILGFFSFLFLVASCANPSPLEKVINSQIVPNKGNGPLKEKIINDRFSGIIISNSLSTDIYKADTHKVIIEAPTDILENIVAKIDGDKVIIGVTNRLENISTERVKVKIYTPEFKSLEANTSAHVKIKDTFTQEKLTMNVSTSASVEGNVEANLLSITVSSSAVYSGKVWADKGELNVNSSASMTTSGKIQHANILASTSGSLDAENTEIGNSKINSSTSGSISVTVYGDSSATATTSGSIELKKKGNPKITITENTSGSVSVM